jgi:hypothetical protein
VKLGKLENNQRFFYCPGCDTHHVIDDKWTYSGTDEKPTVRASVLSKWIKTPDPLPYDDNGDLVVGPDGRAVGSKQMKCHSFITNGNIQYLNDCTHYLAGKTVPMEDVE